MSEDFNLVVNDSPIELEESGITLIAPGLEGSGTYTPKSVGGTREFQIEKPELQVAMTEAGLEDRHTLEINATLNVIPSVQGGRSLLQDVADDEMLLQVPGNEGEFQFVMYTDEAGVISFHYPNKIDRAKALPSRAFGALIQNQYRIKLRSAQDQNPSEKASRGLLGKIGSKILKVLVGKVFPEKAGKAVHWAIENWENKHRAFQGLHGGQNFAELIADTPTAFNQWDSIQGKKALLFVHGTSSSTAGAFVGLNDAVPGRPNIPAELYRRYENRVLAFNHHTMSLSVAENVQKFYDAFAQHTGDYTFDVICHSRGGLVSRGLTLLPDSFLSDKLDGWKKPAGVNIKIDRIVFVATPNDGTQLAEPGNIAAMVERLANFVNQFPDGLVSISGGMILSVASAIADTGLPYVQGLADQSPNSDLVKALTDNTNFQDRYFGIEANFVVPKNLTSAFKEPIAVGANVLVDKLFKDKPNDLVVPTIGVSDNSHFKLAPSHIHRFDGDKVYHTNFFYQVAMGEILKYLA